MTTPLGDKPPFDVPLDVGSLGRQRLTGTTLTKFFEQNKEDFFAVVALVYLDVITDQDSGALLNDRTGFNSFCDVLTAYFLGAPSETLILARDETTGEYVNFFGEGILAHLGCLKGAKQELSIQALYSYDGLEKHAPVWQLVGSFIEHVAIQYFRTRMPLTDAYINAAQTRIQQLKDRIRTLKPVPAKKEPLYG